jgi:hypothetical protein
MVCIQYKDTITLVLTEPDEYGTENLVSQSDVKAAIDFNTSYSHGANQDAVDSDAVCALDPQDPFVIANFYRLEEFLVLIDLFNTPERRTWYKVVRVDLPRDTQLCNQIDHVQLSLKKTTPLSGVTS